MPASGMAGNSRPKLHQSVSCGCGAVTVTVDGPVLSMLMCSCLDCQKATGTGHATVAMLPQSAVSIVGAVKRHPRTADSGALFTRSFCPQCGTPLAGQSSRAPDHVLLPVGLFSAGNDWFAPNQLIFARSHHEWDILPDVPRHDRYRESQP